MLSYDRTMLSYDKYVFESLFELIEWAVDGWMDWLIDWLIDWLLYDQWVYLVSLLGIWSSSSLSISSSSSSLSISSLQIVDLDADGKPYYSQLPEVPEGNDADATIYLSIYLPTYLWTFLSIYSSIHLCIYVFIHLCIYVFIFLFVYVFIFISINPSIHSSNLAIYSYNLQSCYCFSTPYFKLYTPASIDRSI